ncbi:hypothetical protein AXF42_Ash021542 [Apostasia shenzhenica]|uniref:Uncharacterized protein n=1 Tax=Apostasia shenzhenica TaxID=1088818 RepID=A0A2H9ZRU6_9ASPA|nr:hypothetical protein AXF42_Ash021542 [Apostasia shenzhenica]
MLEEATLTRYAFQLMARMNFFEKSISKIGPIIVTTALKLVIQTKAATSKILA